MLLDQFATASQAAISGLGVALLPEFLIEEELSTGKLVRTLDLPMKSAEAYYRLWARMGNCTVRTRHYLPHNRRVRQHGDDDIVVGREFTHGLSGLGLELRQFVNRLGVQVIDYEPKPLAA
jgi:hypothetical protein